MAQENPIALLRQTMESPAMREQIAKALPSNINADKFIRVVMTAVQLNNELAFADRTSLFSSCMRCAQDGLLPDGREAVLNIYNTKKKDQNGREIWVPSVQYLPMVRGLLKTMRNSGEVASIDAAAVYAKDEFVFQRGDDPKIIHSPYMGSDDPGNIVAAYAIVRLLNGEVVREVMTVRDIEKVRSKSKSPNGLMWKDWYDQAAIKSVLKRIAKVLPSSSDLLERVIQADNDAVGVSFEKDVSPQAQQIEKPKSRMAALIERSKADAVP